MTTYEDAYGDFGPVRMTPQELSDLHRVLNRDTRTVADVFPAFTDDNGTTWYRTDMSGSWTALPEYAHQSYRVKEGNA